MTKLVSKDCINKEQLKSHKLDFDFDLVFNFMDKFMEAFKFMDLQNTYYKTLHTCCSKSHMQVTQCPINNKLGWEKTQVLFFSVFPSDCTVHFSLSPTE